MTIYRHSVAVAPTASETETIRILLHIKSKCRLMSTKFKLLVQSCHRTSKSKQVYVQVKLKLG